ncbi:uncharacterized protein isoform X2 [Castor canadensis]|uniref:Uncharacterized protein isoform X2 n=1 Tax=Castor canadensis TaxID=51338 RepID=A0AC58LKY6_CASCN
MESCYVSQHYLKLLAKEILLPECIDGMTGTCHTSRHNVTIYQRVHESENVFHLLSRICEDVCHGFLVIKPLDSSGKSSRVSLQCEFFHEFEGNWNQSRLSHTAYIHRISLQCEFYYVSEVPDDQSLTRHSCHIHGSFTSSWHEFLPHFSRNAFYICTQHPCIINLPSPFKNINIAKRRKELDETDYKCRSQVVDMVSGNSTGTD